MSKHTPGPWGYRHNSDYGDFILTSAGDIQIIGGCGCCESPFLDGDNPEADARLIAAAPELLEAVRELVLIATGDWADEEGLTAIYNANAAIAKAEGEE
jgi:hypothetical protein